MAALRASHRSFIALWAASLAAAAASPSFAQSLLRDETLVIPGELLDPAAALQPVSLIAVVPPSPRKYQKHDLVEIIINQSTTYTFEQSLETDKDYDLDAELSEFPSLRHLLELQLREGDTTPLARAAAGAEKKFEGDGERESKDKLTARISAIVIDVKPNGNLVLEAKETIDKDGEIKTMVLSGICRQEDVTEQNTIQSSKLANLTIGLQYEGDVSEAAKKGIIAEVLDTIFAF